MNSFQTLDRDETNPALGSLIHQQIAESSSRRISFAQFMDLALYHPQHGYYSTKATKLGGQGDFFTAAHLCCDFGELLAEQFLQMWELLLQPHRFTLVEMGAGQGILAKDILAYLRRQHPEFYSCLDYRIVERSPILVALQQRQLAALGEVPVSWCQFEDLPPESIVGCCFSNELVDAFPVHLITVQDGQLREIYVTSEPQPDSPLIYREEVAELIYREEIAELSSPQLGQYFDQIGISILSDRYPNGYRSEINLAALDWIGTVADRLQQGYVLTIDYGYLADRYYSPARSQGTLQCYYQHAHHSNPYIHVGRQDITAHVDFTALQRQGDRIGLQTVGFTQQGLFLMALGLGDRIAAIAQSESRDVQEIQASLRRREALHLLMNPMEFGNFGVLIQSKGMESQTQSLKGLNQPPF